MTSNRAEMFNSLLRDCRSLPVTAIASFTFYKLNVWFMSRKKAAMSLCRSNRPWPNLVATELRFSKNKSKRQKGAVDIVFSTCQNDQSGLIGRRKVIVLR
jgi:hypothetical protein